MRKVKLILVLTLILALLAAPVWAAADAKDLTARESFIDSGVRSMTMLQDGSAYIADAGGQTLYISCETNAYYTVAEVGLEINLQRWNGSYWSTIQTLPFYNTYASSIRKDLAVPALAGYSYRLVTRHYCEDGANYEYLYTTTNGITVY